MNYDVWLLSEQIQITRIKQITVTILFNNYFVHKAYAMNVTLPKYILVVLNELEKFCQWIFIGKKNKLSGLKVEEVK